MSKQTILLTGSSGLIGMQICHDLSKLGHSVRKLDIRGEGEEYGSVLSPMDLRKAVVGCTGVIHLAAVSRVNWGEQDPVKCTATNIADTKNVLHAINWKNQNRPWLFFGSSREVYGQSDKLPVTEPSALRPMNHYARTKVAAEDLVSKAAENDLVSSILRFSTVYGSVQDHYDRVVPAFCRAAASGRELRVDGLDNSLDTTHVADVSYSIANVAEILASGKGLSPMHFTTGTSTGLLGLAKLIVQLSESEGDIVPSDQRHFDVANFVGDSSLARSRVGWDPSTSLEHGLMNLISDLRSTGGA